MIANRKPELHELLRRIHSDLKRDQELTIRAAEAFIENPANWERGEFVTVLKHQTHIENGNPCVIIEAGQLRTPSACHGAGLRVYDVTGQNELSVYESAAELVEAGWVLEGLDSLDQAKRKFIFTAIDNFKDSM